MVVCQTCSRKYGQALQRVECRTGKKKKKKKKEKKKICKKQTDFVKPHKEKIVKTLGSNSSEK